MSTREPASYLQKPILNLGPKHHKFDHLTISGTLLVSVVAIVGAGIDWDKVNLILDNEQSIYI